MSRSAALIAALVVQIIYGLNYTFANDVIDGGYIGPFGFILIRVSSACILFWAISIFIPSQKIEKKDFKILLVASIFGIATNMLAFFKGLEYTTPIHSSVIMTVTPITVLILSWIFLNEKITKINVLGIFIGFIGAIALSIYGKATHSGDNILLGNSLIFLNATAFSIYLVIIKKVVAKYHPLAFMKWLFLFGTIIVIPFGYNELAAVRWTTFTPYIWLCVSVVVIGATFLAYLLNPLALVKLRASTLSTFIYLQPVFAGIFAILLGSDTLSTIKVVAAVSIFVGVYLVTKKPKSETA
ncbi:MAG: DMT family transporter [Flavobacteriaceae bacterium]|nr:DMT family transporter [Flavobacteriaceae bacterium]